jgi:hypothetical protein
LLRLLCMHRPLVLVLMHMVGAWLLLLLLLLLLLPCMSLLCRAVCWECRPGLMGLACSVMCRVAWLQGCTAAPCIGARVLHAGRWLLGGHVRWTLVLTGMLTGMLTRILRMLPGCSR